MKVRIHGPARTAHGNSTSYSADITPTIAAAGSFGA
jgi:hypothetical protein